MGTEDRMACSGGWRLGLLLCLVLCFHANAEIAETVQELGEGGLPQGMQAEVSDPAVPLLSELGSPNSVVLGDTVHRKRQGNSGGHLKKMALKAKRKRKATKRAEKN